MDSNTESNSPSLPRASPIEIILSEPLCLVSLGPYLKLASKKQA